VPLVPVVIMIFIAGTCMYAHLPAFWPIPTMFLGAAAAASAIGFINMVGNLGGYFGPNLVGNAVTEDISWLQNFIKTDPEKLLTPEEARPIWEQIESASTVEELRRLRTTLTLPQEKLLTDDQVARIKKLESNVEEGKKLPAADFQRLNMLLTAVTLRVPLDQEQQQDLVALLGQGASFASALRRLAPWPIAAAVIILIVGYFRKRAPAKVAIAT
jgi:hypothetical protein